ncbi:MAG: hypothetical protein WC371_04205 [Parachlamydiales bacterium]|jgi:hypothetical protein
MKLKIKEKIKSLLNFKSPILAKFGLEKALLNSFGAKAVASFLGPLQIILIMRYFSAEMQGYYYTFGSLLTFQAVLDLGLGSIVTYFASHEWGRLKYLPETGIVGDEKALKRLVSFGRAVFKWYFLAAFLLFVGLSFGGLVFFDLKETVGFSWKKPWIFLSLANSLIFFFMPVWALLEGCSQQNRVAYYRLIYSLIWGSINCLGVFLGAGLWVNVIALSGCLCWNLYFLKRYFFVFFKTFFNKLLVIKIPWKEEVLPMQWRLALGSLCGFIAFGLFNPVIFRFFGPVMAGQVGLVLFLTGVITNFSLIYLNAYLPQFGTLLAQGRLAEREALFLRVLGITFLLSTVLSLGLLFCVYLGKSLGFYIFNVRMLASPCLEYFVLGNFLICLSCPFSIYMRSYKKEPLLTISLIAALATVFLLLLWGYKHNLEKLAVSYLVLHVFGLVWIFFLWINFRKKQIILTKKIES